MVLDLVQLRSFAEVATRGTIAAAASAQGYTAPAVSQHLAKLEAALDARLFDRVGGRLSLSPAGRALLPVALEMLDLDTRARTAVREPTAAAQVSFAGFASAISTLLVPRLAELTALASIEIREAEDAEALRDLGLGSVDVVLTQEYEGMPIERNRRFTFTPLVSDRLTLVLPPDRSPATTLAEVADDPWLLNGRTTRCAEATTRVLQAAGLSPTIVGIVADNAALLALVAAGQGVTVVPARVLEDRRHDVVVGTQDLGVARTIHAVTRTATTPALAAVLDVLTRETPGTRGTRGTREAG